MIYQPRGLHARPTQGVARPPKAVFPRKKSFQVPMKTTEFKRIKDGRLDRLRRHVFDASLTPKQRRELRREVRRREQLMTEHKLNRQLKNRVNATIRSSTTPRSVRATASRYKNVMTNAQRANMHDQATRVRKSTEAKYLAQFEKNGNYKKLFASLRELKRLITRAKNTMASK